MNVMNIGCYELQPIFKQNTDHPIDIPSVLIIGADFHFHKNYYEVQFPIATER